MDVAEHARHRGVVSSPRQDLEAVEVGHREHVGFLDPAVALDGGAVEAHALVEGGLELDGGDGERLEDAEDVGEPEAHEAHPSLLDGSEHVLQLVFHCGAPRLSGFCLCGHRCRAPASTAAPLRRVVQVYDPATAGRAGGRPVHRAFTHGQRPGNRRPGCCIVPVGPPRLDGDRPPRRRLRRRRTARATGMEHQQARDALPTR